MESKFKIKCTYDTGDSFGTQTDVIYILEESYSTIEKATAILNTLKEHYEYYKAENRSYSFDKEKKAEIIKSAKTKPWFVEEYDFCVKLLTDNDKEWQICLPYCGYFERLTAIKIVVDYPKVKVTF